VSAATVRCASHGFTGNGRACPHCERDRQRLALASRASLRATKPFSRRQERGRVEAIDVDGLALFDAHRSPTLF
jgi:hypothetical protein